MAIQFLSEKTAKILSNSTARKVLKNLDKRKPISQIAKELKLPLTTVDYNISQLEKSGLVKSGYYKWSKRGNKMKLYEPAGEVFIYAPKSKPGLMEALNKFVVPVILVAVGGLGYLFQKLFYGSQASQNFVSREAVMSGVDSSAPVAESAVQAVAQSEPQLWFWFMFVAGLVMLILYVLKRCK